MLRFGAKLYWMFGDATVQMLKTLNTSGGSVYSLCVTNDRIMCGTFENVVHIWSLETFEELTTLEGHEGTVYALAVCIVHSKALHPICVRCMLSLRAARLPEEAVRATVSMRDYCDAHDTQPSFYTGDTQRPNPIIDSTHLSWVVGHVYA